MFYSTHMMTGSSSDRLRYLEIAGAAAHHAQGWQLTAKEEARAVAEIRRAAADVLTCWLNAQALPSAMQKPGATTPGAGRSPGCASPPGRTRR